MAKNSNGYRQPALKVDGASREDLESVLSRLVASDAVSTDTINSELDRTREITKDKTKAVSETASINEQAELLTNLECQYPKMKVTLERRTISTKGMPTWEQIKKGLTPEVLKKALKHQQPELLLIPPTTRQSKVDAINKHPAKNQKYYFNTCRPQNMDLWNGGNSEIANNWRVKIDEGIQDIAQDEKIYDGKRTNYEMTKLWVEKYAKEGLDVMNDADAWLILLMKRLDEGEPIDSNTYTVLNGKNLTSTSDVARGFWDFCQGFLDYDLPTLISSYLRLRGSVEVDVPKA